MLDRAEILRVATTETFDEEDYLAANPDVRAAVAGGAFASGRAHFDAHGRAEGRRQRGTTTLAEARAAKMARLAPHMRDDLPFHRRGPKYDYLSPELRELSGIADTANVSQNAYDPPILELIAGNGDGLVLDCGAGSRDRYFANVVNLEIVDYESTDVLAVGEVLPFKDDTFDGIISVAVLEHVRDPFACAREIARVLKPGGRLLCAVPFLQPLHGYPHHYYNMTGQGLRALFDRYLEVEQHHVPASLLPIWTLTWIVTSWSQGLRGRARRNFLSSRLSDFLADPVALLGKDYVKGLSEEKNFELASGTYLFARKPG